MAEYTFDVRHVATSRGPVPEKLMQPGLRITIYPISPPELGKSPVQAITDQGDAMGMAVWEWEEDTGDYTHHNRWYAVAKVVYAPGICADCETAVDSDKDYLCGECRKTLDNTLLTR